ncbi:cytochrome c oxidase subunit II [Bacillus sp. FJAT-47783]|uniref:cytochrome c oxidase subunit II n=1 Tax=Bacillus sp. FJAT-47783 TaxID=2922712 RepID=UPI001FAB7317|nr:cytochrome c oxidase subunit II [Bacillus sp. FJAT-47783]
MHMHKLEKIWLMIGVGTLILFLTIVGIGAFAHGNEPPSDLATLDPEKVDVTPPFDEPGLKKIGENEYELVIVSQAFSFSPKELKVPKDATVHIIVTSKDVVHGLEIVGTNVNMMVTPGHVNSLTYTFKDVGNYLILCNEYCGVGHQMMSASIEVVEA